MRLAFYCIAFLLPVFSGCGKSEFDIKSSSLDKLAAALPEATEKIDPLRLGQILREKNTLAEKVAALEKEMTDAKQALTKVTVVVACSSAVGSSVRVRLVSRSDSSVSRDLQQLDCTGAYHLVDLDTRMQFSPGRYFVTAEYYAAPGKVPSTSLTVADAGIGAGQALSGSALANRPGIFCQQEVTADTISKVSPKDGPIAGSLVFTQSCEIALKGGTS